MSSVDFEELNPENIDQVVLIYTDVLNAVPWNDGWGIESATERLTSFAKYPEFFGLKILLDGAAIGFALGWAERWVDAWQFHLYEMCVSPKMQGKGYGRILLAELEKRSQQKGQTALFLQTGTHVPARKFYEARGYRDRGLTLLGKRYAD